MIKHLLTIWLLTFLLFSGYAQNINVDYYRFGARPSVLSSKFVTFNNIGKEYYFGISDPGLDSTTAVLQATKRAQALLALSSGVKVKNYTTGFQAEKYRGNVATYESMVDLALLNRFVPKVAVIDTFFTVFNEAIVFVSPTNEIDSAFDFLFNRYLVEYQYGGYTEYSEVMDIYVKDSLTPGETMVYMKYGNTEDVYTQIEKEVFNLPITHYNYILPGDSLPQRYRYGLWINFMRELNVMLGSYSRLRSEQVRKMGEMYNYNEEKLNEGVSANVVKFRIKGLIFKNNEINIDLLLENY